MADEFDQYKTQADEFDQYKKAPTKPPEEPTGVVAALKRVGSGFAGIPAAVQKAFTDPPTPEETAHAGGQTNKIGLGLRRLLIEPSEQLRKSADQKGVDAETSNLRKFSSYIPVPVLGPMAESIVERGRLGMTKDPKKPGDPSGALTELATYTAIPKLIEGTPGAAKAILGKATESAPAVLRAAAATESGRAALQAEEDVGLQFTREQLRKADEAHRAEVEKVEKTNRSRAEEHQKKSAAIKAENEAGAEQNAKKAGLIKHTEQQASDFQQKANAAVVKGGAVREAANEKYQAVRDAIGDATVPPTSVANAVRRAKTEIIKGVPETTKQFEEILKREGDAEGPLDITGKGERLIDPGEPGYEELKGAYRDAGLLSVEKPFTFDDIQGYKTELDRKLYGDAITDGDVKRAVASVRDALAEEMRQMAQKAGVSEQLTEANKFYERMMKTFYDRESPIRQARQASDPGKAGAGVIALTDPGVDKWISENLEKISPELAEQARGIRSTARQAKEIKPYKPQEIPEAPVPEPTPQRTSPDIEGAKRKSLEDTRSRLRKSRGYNIIPGREQLRKLHGAALGDPEVQEMLSKMSPEEQNLVKQYLALPPRARLIFEGKQLVGQ